MLSSNVFNYKKRTFSTLATTFDAFNRPGTDPVAVAFIEKLTCNFFLNMWACDEVVVTEGEPRTTVPHNFPPKPTITRGFSVQRPCIASLASLSSPINWPAPRLSISANMQKKGAPTGCKQPLKFEPCAEQKISIYCTRILYFFAQKFKDESSTYALIRPLAQDCAVCTHSNVSLMVLPFSRVVPEYPQSLGSPLSGQIRPLRKRKSWADARSVCWPTDITHIQRTSTPHTSQCW